MIHGDRTTRIDELEQQVTVASLPERTSTRGRGRAARGVRQSDSGWSQIHAPVSGDHLGTRAVTTFDERIAPLASRYVTPLAANVDGASR